MYAEQDKLSEKKLRIMVQGFGVSGLRELMGFAGRKQTGRLEDLRRSALELVNSDSLPVKVKIRELHRAEKFRMRPAAPPIKKNGGDSASVRSNLVSRPRIQASLISSGKDVYDSLNPPPPITIGPSIYEVPRLSDNNSNSRNVHRRHPIKFKQNPLYEVLQSLIRPVVALPDKSVRDIRQEVEYTFQLTADQAKDLASSRCAEGKEFQTQVHLRCCLDDNSCEQEDNFPINLRVKINGKFCLLPNLLDYNHDVGFRRQSRPIDITPLLNVTPAQLTSSTTHSLINHLTLDWDTNDMAKYAVAVYLVRKLTAEQLMDKLKSKGIRQVDHSKYTRNSDSGIAAVNLRVSLLCPLGKRRMEFPCRALDCTHLQCFEAFSYIRMNLLNPTWNCPVCDRPAPFESLYGDGLFHYIVETAEVDCTEVLFQEDGSWEVVRQAASGGSDVVIVDCETNRASTTVIEVINIEDD